MFSVARKAQRFLLSAGLCALLPFCVQANATEPARNSSIAQAINGLDAVELSFGQSVEGVTDFSYVFAGKKWVFSNPHNLAMFVSDPFDFMGDEYDQVRAPGAPLADDAQMSRLLDTPVRGSAQVFTRGVPGYDRDAVILDGVQLPDNAVDLAHAIEADLKAVGAHSSSGHH